jgi:hypothetical protein
VTVRPSEEYIWEGNSYSSAHPIDITIGGTSMTICNKYVLLDPSGGFVDYADTIADAHKIAEDISAKSNHTLRAHDFDVILKHEYDLIPGAYEHLK